uniref:5-formyltetrahydrofolate cyclo-ligase n=1 Tax=Timema douglasi TaxID=61478 RepID=A0A7R8VS55_TIMDO|nr:unnamed protein product [Timema douglasi]
MIQHSNMKIMKDVLRKEVKKILATLSAQEKEKQSKLITSKLLSLLEYQKSNRVSIYLHMDDEVRTSDILEDIFRTGKICFIPRYATDSTHMDMLRVNTLQELESLPLTNWNIRQPLDSDERENALNSGHRHEAPLGNLRSLSWKKKAIPRAESLTSSLTVVFTRGGANSGSGEGEFPSYSVMTGLPNSRGGLDLIVVPGLAFSREGARLGRGKGYYDTYLTKCCQLQNTSPVTVGLAFKQQLLDKIPTQEFDFKMDYVLSVE